MIYIPRKILLLSFLYLCIFTVTNYGGTYFISPKGTAIGTGSPTNPFKTFRQAIQKTGGGNTFLFMQGIYTEGQFTLRPEHKGSPTNPTVLKSLKKYRAVLHGSTTHNIYVNRGCEWVIIDGLTSSGAMLTGIKSNANHTVIRNCWIHSNAGNGIEAHNVNGSVIERNLIEFNGKHIQYDHGVYADGNDLIIRQNIVRFNSAHGLHLYSSLKNSTIENNLIYGNTRSGVLVFSPVDSAGKNRIIHNTIVDNGYGIVLARAENEIVANNIIAFNNKWAYIPESNIFLQDSNSENVKISGNLLWPQDHKWIIGNIYKKPTFLLPQQGIYYLSAGSSGKGEAKSEYLLEKDFFGRKRSTHKGDIGCFAYSPDIQPVRMKEVWYYGWPFARAKEEGYEIPDLWDYDSIIDVQE